MAERPPIQFDQLAFFAYLFALRVPSEADFTPSSPKWPSGHALPNMKRASSARYDVRTPQLFPNPTHQKNRPTGCAPYCPCFCEVAGAAKLRRLGPVRFWLRWVCSRAPRLLLNEISPRIISRVIRAVFAKLGVSRANCFTPHGCRRGAAQELKGRGSQRTTAAGAGVWRSLSCRVYLGAKEDAPGAMGRLLIDGCDPDSSDGEQAPSFGGKHLPPTRRAVGARVFRARKFRGVGAFFRIPGAMRC